MPLVEHLRELRRRLVFAVLAILIGTVVGWIIYPSAFEFLKQPYVDGIAPLLQRKGFEAKLVLSGGVGSAFSFRLKFALVIGLVISAPVWIGQMWAFILPALHHNERRWAYLLTALRCSQVVLPSAIWCCPRASRCSSASPPIRWTCC